MADLYTKNGLPLRVRGDRVYNPSGQNFGYIRGDRVYGLDGRYRGSIVNDRLVYRSSQSATGAGARAGAAGIGGSGTAGRGGSGLSGDEPNIDP
jgi:4-fold beta-flower domain-containing protein